jgi:hypothetical protein
MNGRSAIGERGRRRSALDLQDVFDRCAGRLATPVRQRVRADLGEGAFEEHQVGLVQAGRRALAQAPDGIVDRVEPGFELGQRGVELEGLVEFRSQ